MYLIWPKHIIPYQTPAFLKGYALLLGTGKQINFTFVYVSIAFLLFKQAAFKPFKGQILAGKVVDKKSIQEPEDAVDFSLR
jgi:hypothetical protein